MKMEKNPKMSEFEEVLKSLKSDLTINDEVILEFAKGKSPLIQEISSHLVSGGGKRIRPILLFLSSKLFSEKPVHNLAAAVELIHSATLLHDDVVDESAVRRGKKTANAIWDNKATILVGDYLFSIAFQLMVRSNNLEVLDLLAKTSSIMADGEVMQLENSSDIALSQEKYLEIIFGKTAVLFSAACEVGALINDRDDKEIQSLRNFGRNLGVIFQIIDDLLDYSSDEKTLGKDLGNDFFEGKVTLPIILTYKNSSNTDQKIISDLFENNLINADKNYDNLKQILEIMKKADAFELTKQKASEFKDFALKDLENFPTSKAKNGLLTVLNHALSRIF